MTSKAPKKDTFVWIWLPGANQPVVAGRFQPLGGDRYGFVYGRSYLGRTDAVPIYGPELPLRPGLQQPPETMQMASSLRDGAPDAWGRRVIINRAMRGLGGGAKCLSGNRLSHLNRL